ncbi:MAG: acetyl-CoA C-acyltransferase [Epsilonproteobacteria bacterium]|nr:MAG: acetyl-CoA C-acyltransferase [Campylobacterota bacterium]RLA67449.1 MAG: acetyl-CoA C-acyltransferase [Campylobacterota bacterium]
MSNTGKIYLVSGKRTPFGSFGGSLTKIRPVDLAVNATKGMLEEIGLSPEKINQVILGNVVPSSTDTMYGGRHLALKAGMLESTPGITINRLCGSGIEAILSAFNLIKLGKAECILASGTENMSMVPHLTYGARFGTKYGALKSVDMLLDALTDQYSNTPMGITAENLAEMYKITRDECEEFSLNSHQKAAKAYKDNLLQGEISPVALKKGELTRDEHLREDVSLEGMRKLRPNFKADGVVTAATASGIVDGAASVLVASESFVEKEGLTPLAEIIDGHTLGVNPKIMGIGPVPVIREMMDKNNLKLEDINLFEINEAFAAQALAVSKELNLDPAILNIWGGAVAFGHPLGATGVRISLTLARQLKELKLKRGIASACIGGGQGIAILLESI